MYAETLTPTGANRPELAPFPGLGRYFPNPTGALLYSIGNALSSAASATWDWMKGAYNDTVNFVTTNADRLKNLVTQGSFNTDTEMKQGFTDLLRSAQTREEFDAIYAQAKNSGKMDEKDLAILKSSFDMMENRRAVNARLGSVADPLHGGTVVAGMPGQILKAITHGSGGFTNGAIGEMIKTTGGKGWDVYNLNSGGSDAQQIKTDAVVNQAKGALFNLQTELDAQKAKQSQLQERIKDLQRESDDIWYGRRENQDWETQKAETDAQIKILREQEQAIENSSALRYLQSVADTAKQIYKSNDMSQSEKMTAFVLQVKSLETMKINGSTPEDKKLFENIKASMYADTANDAEVGAVQSAMSKGNDDLLAWMTGGAIGQAREILSQRMMEGSYRQKAINKMFK